MTNDSMKHSITIAALLLVPLAEVCAITPPNFVVVLGEGHGWSSTSAQMDDAVPASKSVFVRTPNLERLAQGGMRFANFYAPSPRCTPSRATLFTGKSPAQLHMTFVGEGKKESGASPNGRELAQDMPDKAKALNRRLGDYLAAMNAQMPTPNPNDDATKPTEHQGGG